MIFIRILILSCLVGLGSAQPADSIFVSQVGHGRDGANNLIRTDFSFRNLAATTNRIEIRTFDANGAPVNLLSRPGSPFQSAGPTSVLGVEVLERGFGTATSSADQPGTPGGLVAGWAEIQASAPVAVEVLFSILDARDGSLTTSTSVIPSAPTRAASFVAFAQRQPVANTGVALLNPPSNGQDAQVDVVILDSYGRIRGQSSLNLAAGGRSARFLNEIVSGLQDFTGTFELRSNVDVVVLPLRQEGVELTTQDVHPARQLP